MPPKQDAFNNTTFTSLIQMEWMKTFYVEKNPIYEIQINNPNNPNYKLK